MSLPSDSEERSGTMSYVTALYVEAEELGLDAEAKAALPPRRLVDGRVVVIFVVSHLASIWDAICAQTTFRVSNTPAIAGMLRPHILLRAHRGKYVVTTLLDCLWITVALQDVGASIRAETMQSKVVSSHICFKVHMQRRPREPLFLRGSQTPEINKQWDEYEAALKDFQRNVIEKERSPSLEILETRPSTPNVSSSKGKSAVNFKVNERSPSIEILETLPAAPIASSSKSKASMTVKKPWHLVETRPAAPIASSSKSKASMTVKKPWHLVETSALTPSDSIPPLTINLKKPQHLSSVSSSSVKKTKVGPKREEKGSTSLTTKKPKIEDGDSVAAGARTAPKTKSTTTASRPVASIKKPQHFAIQKASTSESAWPIVPPPEPNETELPQRTDVDESAIEGHIFEPNADKLVQ
ncbi:hypothetical protein BDZ97DRAFT_1924104 [Flammula alnicola]|nr:hypothetical protein BDZ97DRAFT_1924104 [Flammula alnicola]